MGILDFFFKKRVKVLTHLDPELLKQNEIIQAQQQKIQSQEAQLSQIFAKEKEKRDIENAKDKENELNKKFKEQKEDLDAHRYGKIIKLKNFYKHLLLNKKYRESLEICDKNDEVVLGKFGDFGIMEGGKLCIIDNKGELMAYGKTLSHILYKPDAFENMFRRKRFLIPMDKDGNWTEDIEYKEIPEPMDAEFDEETGQIKRIIWSKVKTSEVKKIIANKMEQINSLQTELERQDGVIIILKQEIDDLKRTLRIYNSQSDIAQTNLSKSLSRFLETEKRMGEMHMSLTKLTELKAVYENLIDKKDDIITSLIKKLELTGEPKLDQLKASIKEDIEFYKAVLPDRVEITEEAPKEPKPVTQPGDVIKK
ncbi:MAG: hypothetical protein AABY22_23420 [Nanoarchaeota archaeon]